MAIALPKLEMPQLDRKTALISAAVVVALAVGGWFAWDTFMSEPPPPPKPVAITPKPAAPKPAPAPAPAPVVVAPAPVAPPAPAPVVETKPAAPAPMAEAPRRRSRANEDARECLRQPTDAKIAACAEKFR